MKLPHSLNLSSKPIVPFSATDSNPVINKFLQTPLQQPSWLGDLNVNWTKRSKSLSERETQESKVKLNIKLNWNSSKHFFQEKKKIEGEMRNLFSFLEKTDIFAKINLIDKLNLKITSGEIITVDQLRLFFDKAKELADCIKMYLLKNEYNENFMQKISMDVFEKGFDSQNQENIRKLS